MNLQTPVGEAGRVYKQYASRLEKLGIFTLRDFLYHIPFRYEDYREIRPIASLRVGQTVTVRGMVKDIKTSYTQRFKKMQKATIADATGTLDVTWFNQEYLTNVLRKGEMVSLSGRVERFGKDLTLLSPEYEIFHSSENEVTTIHTGRLVPIYPETRGVSSKWLRRQTYKLLHDLKPWLEEFLPQEIAVRNHLIPFHSALFQIHFPDTLEQVKEARSRLAFDELFLLQLASAVRRQKWQKEYIGTAFHIAKFRKHIDLFWKQLPFSLTTAQVKALDDIFQDFEQTTPMNRLVQGDVGSGKTVVATIAMYVAYLNGFQSVLMAPTEILAQQHYATIQRLLEPLGIKVSIATGSRKEHLDEFDILIGTHAVLSHTISYDRIGLVVIDEQQRFGVEQRAILRSKGKNPHVLTMTATPIPRTVALTMYGDLNLSVLDEMPKGRKVIKTWMVPTAKRTDAYTWIRKQIEETDSQIFIICPFIEESENMSTVKAALSEYERLKGSIFPDLPIGLLHGKLKSKEKDQVLEDFKQKKYAILVATPVVEVGIDIPNATVIVIEAAERFGLAQLHQLRGRVGRGDKQSYCFLFTEGANIETWNKLKSLEHMSNGAELAELDLKLRGPGDMYGIAQSGLPALKIASFGDMVLIEKVKKEVNLLFHELDRFPLLNEHILSTFKQEVSPD